MASLLRLAQTTRQVQSMIQSIGESPIERDENTGGPTVKGEENDDIVTFTKIGFVAIIALIALGTSGLSFYWIESFLVDFSSVLTMIFAPLVLYQKRTLRKLGSFRSHHNKLRLAVGNVRHENERMEFTLHKLSIQTSKYVLKYNDFISIDHGWGRTRCWIYRLIDVLLSHKQAANSGTKTSSGSRKIRGSGGQIAQYL